MRRDFDFVDMTDYQSDMKETAEQAAHIIKDMRRDRDFWRAAFWKAVAANGGKVRIFLDREAGPITRLQPVEKGQEVSYYQDDMTTEFRLEFRLVK